MTFDPAKLEELLTAREGDPVSVGEFAPMTGGYSRLMAQFTATTPAGTRRLVARGDPPPGQGVVDTDRAREWEVLAALTALGDIPMPAAHHFDDGSVVGTRTIVLDYVEGSALTSAPIDPQEYPDYAARVADAAAAIHGVGLDRIPAVLERPGDWDKYIATKVAAWRDAEAAHVISDPFARYLAEWLDTHRPPPAPFCLVHGELQTSNVMVCADGSLSVVDWEFAHIGDPREDLGWFMGLGAFYPPDLVGADPVGFCTRYAERSGLGPDVINPLTLGYFALLSFATYVGALFQQSAGMATGAASSLMGAYMVNVFAQIHSRWMQGADGIDAGMAMLRDAASIQ